MTHFSSTSIDEFMKKKKRRRMVSRGGKKGKTAGPSLKKHYQVKSQGRNSISRREETVTTPEDIEEKARIITFSKRPVQRRFGLTSREREKIKRPHSLGKRHFNPQKELTSASVGGGEGGVTSRKEEGEQEAHRRIL